MSSSLSETTKMKQSIQEIEQEDASVSEAPIGSYFIPKLTEKEEIKVADKITENFKKKKAKLQAIQAAEPVKKEEPKPAEPEYVTIDNQDQILSLLSPDQKIKLTLENLSPADRVLLYNEVRKQNYRLYYREYYKNNKSKLQEVARASYHRKNSKKTEDKKPIGRPRKQDMAFLETPPAA